MYYNTSSEKLKVNFQALFEDIRSQHWMAPYICAEKEIDLVGN